MANEIKSLSPHYKIIPFISPRTGLISTAYTLKIFVWIGLKTSAPIAEHFKITKNNAEGSAGNDRVNVSRLTRDFIDFTPQTTSGVTQLLDGNNQAWVKTVVFYTTSDATELTIPQLLDIQLMSKGFGYGFDGENPPLPTNKILIPNNSYKVDKNAGRFVVPILLDESAGSIDAVNDTFNIFFQDTVLDVLANDNLGFAPTVIYTFDDSSFGATDGSLSIENDTIKYNVGSILNTPLTATYTIKDSIGDEDTATITINISALPSGVTAVDDSYLVLNQGVQNLTVQDNDVEGTPPTTITAIDQTGITSGTLAIDGTSEFIIYTPNGIVPSSNETFTYDLTDTITTDQGTVTLRVKSGSGGGGGSSVNMSTAGETVADDACPLSLATVRFHDGIFSLPVLNDKIFTDSGLTAIFAGGSKYFKIPSDNVIQIDNSGVVLNAGVCIGGIFNPF